MTREEARSWIIDHWGNDLEDGTNQSEVVKICLSALSESAHTGEWIPVSERLPLLLGTYKISDDVLITNGYENYMGYLVERKGKNFWHYYGSDIEVGIGDNDDDVVAWMPLPEPYKAER